MVVAIGLILFLFFLSDSRIVSHSPFAYNLQNRFWDNETIVAHFPSNKGRTRTFESYATLQPYVCVFCAVCVGWAQAVRRNKMFCLLFFWFR